MPVPTWTKEETNRARNLWETTEQSARQIAELLGKTRYAVIGKAHRNGWRISKNKSQPQGQRRSPRPIKYQEPRQKQPKPPPKAIGSDVLWTEGVSPVTLMQLAPHHCRWPLDGGWYCGGVKTEGSSYCESHAVIASNGPVQPYSRTFGKGFR